MRASRGSSRCQSKSCTQDSAFEAQIDVCRCGMYRSPAAFKDTTPLYTCTMDDVALSKYEPNKRALDIAVRMRVFDFRDNGSINGPCLFLGPNDTGLLPEEIKRFSK